MHGPDGQCRLRADRQQAGQARPAEQHGDGLHAARHVEARVHMAHFVAFPGGDAAAPDVAQPRYASLHAYSPALDCKSYR